MVGIGRGEKVGNERMGRGRIGWRIGENGVVRGQR